MRQARTDRDQAQRARLLSKNLANDPQAKTALTDYADELDRRADALEQAARVLQDKDEGAGT